jgi:hypothetical protein
LLCSAETSFSGNLPADFVMRLSVSTEICASALGLVGVGAFAVAPEWLAPFLGWSFIVSGAFVFLAGIRVENGALISVERKSLLNSLLASWWKAGLFSLSTILAVAAVAYFQHSPFNRTHPSLVTLFITDNTPTNSISPWFPRTYNGETIWCRAVYNMAENTKFISILLPQTTNENTFSSAFVAAQDYQSCTAITDLMRFQFPLPSGVTLQELSKIPFSGMLNLYHETLLTLSQKASIEKEFENHGVSHLNFRDINYQLAIWSQIKQGKVQAPPAAYVIKTKPSLAIVEE